MVCRAMPHHSTSHPMPPTQSPSSQTTWPLWALGACAVLSLPWGMWLGLVTSPPERHQGEVVRLMYFHVPMAWIALLFYGLIGVASALFLKTRQPRWALAGQAMAPLGALAAFLCLLTGSLWGHSTWGAWWVWDGRLTSMLILFFLYCGLIAVQNAFDAPERGWTAAAVLALVGLCDLPVIHFSVQWWSTLHQGSSLRLLPAAAGGGHSAMNAAFLVPLLLCGAGFMALAVLCALLRYHMLQDKLALLEHWRHIRWAAPS
ncbi:heme ABC transporter permease CcmC [Formicincola oecophyllae]|nr:heme ABC transporter permease CcmC [Formicincola oecophyllae]